MIQALLSAMAGDLLLGIIFYAFAMYGFPEKALKPARLIAIFTIILGLGYPLLGIVLNFIYSKFKVQSRPLSTVLQKFSETLLVNLFRSH